MRIVLRDCAIKALAALMFPLTLLPPATLAVQADYGPLTRELTAVALPSFEKAVLRNRGAALRLPSARRGERSGTGALAAALAAMALAGLALRAAPVGVRAARRPGRRRWPALAGPRAPPAPGLAD
jgi:hypothetical protein